MRFVWVLTLTFFLSAEFALSQEVKPTQAQEISIERGRYIVKMAGCNDCHTSGFAPSEGKIPESEWLLGDRIGWRGPWGTTYASNLRRSMLSVNEDQWVQYVRAVKTKPPMPWWVLREMEDGDLRSMYRFVSSLGSKGEAVPAYVPPDKEPQTPFFNFVPMISKSLLPKP